MRNGCEDWIEEIVIIDEKKMTKSPYGKPRTKYLDLNRPSEPTLELSDWLLIGSILFGIIATIFFILGG